MAAVMLATETHTDLLHEGPKTEQLAFDSRNKHQNCLQEKEA